MADSVSTSLSVKKLSRVIQRSKRFLDCWEILTCIHSVFFSNCLISVKVTVNPEKLWDQGRNTPWMGYQSIGRLDERLWLAIHPKHQPYDVKGVLVSWRDHILALALTDWWLSWERTSFLCHTNVLWLFDSHTVMVGKLAEMCSIWERFDGPSAEALTPAVKCRQSW